MEFHVILWWNHVKFHGGITLDEKNASIESRHGISRKIPWSTSGGMDSPPTPVEQNGTDHYLMLIDVKDFRGDTIHTYCVEDVCPARYSAVVARSADSCINLTRFTVPGWHRGIVPESVNLE